MKRYTIFILNKVLTKTKTAYDGKGNPVERKNLGTPPVYPPTFVGKKPVYADTSDIHGDDYTRRTELWEDSAGTASDEQIYAACPRIRDDLAAQIRLVGNYRLGMLATPYMDRERETWTIQMMEAMAVDADPAAATPYIDGIAAARGIPREQLLEYVMGNVRLYLPASAAILGQQQALLDKIYSEQSVEKLLATTWPA